MDEKKRLFEAFLDGDKMIPSGKRGAKGTLDKAGTEAARECTNARSRQNRILDNAVGAIEAKIFKYDLLENRILFVRLEDDDDFPAELNGLVAMKLCAKFKRPTIVARLNNEGYDRGSMRGMNQSSLSSFKDFLESSGMFEYVSGHDNAAGVSIQDSNLRQFHAWANEQLKDTDFGENVYDVNFIRSASSSDIKNIVADIDKYAGIWGQGNAEPLIYIKDININSSDVQVIGKNADTIKFEKFGVTYIKFHAKELIEKIRKLNGEIRLEVVGKTNMNEWMGRFTP
jgi:single-stranded-DNA-specific exonuclease